MIKVIIFDLGGVVLDYSQTWHNKRLAEISGKSESAVYAVVERYLERFETGKMHLNQFERAVAKELGIKKKEVMWRQFFETHARINEDVYESLMELHKDFRTAILSNIDRSRYIAMRKILPFTYVDSIFASCYIGFKKPDKRIYRFALGKLGILPNEAIFVDNAIKNVYGARSVGINAVLFEGRRKLDMELSKFIDL